MGMDGGRAEVTRLGVRDLAKPVTVTPQLDPGSPGGGTTMAEAMGYGVRVRTAWGRLGATNSCFKLGGWAFRVASTSEVERVELLQSRRQGVSSCFKLGGRAWS